jgi:hypothetical protein
MMHPNQIQPQRTIVSRAPAKPGPRRQSSLSFATRRRRPLGKVLPPGARQRTPPVRRPERLDVLARCTNYAEQAMRAGVVKLSLTPAQRRRVTHKGKLDAAQRAWL